MADERFEDGAAERDLTPEERAAMEFATRNLSEEIRALLVSRPRAWTPPARTDAAASLATA